MRYSHLLAGMAAAALAMGGMSTPQALTLPAGFGLGDDGAPLPIAYGPGGHTQGSSRDTEHERHLSRLARKARRQTRLHGHSASSHRALQRLSGDSDRARRSYGVWQTLPSHDYA